MPGHEKDIIAKSVAADGYANIKGKVLVNEENGWEDYVLRKFEIQNGGHSGSHVHDYEHIVYVLQGKGTMIMEEKEYPVEGGCYTVIPKNIQHQLLNNNESGEDLQFLCIVPKRGHVGF